METERSYGILSIREETVLMIHHAVGHWTFPKGRPEAGETPHETATRELQEELGLTVVRFHPGEPIEETYTLTRSGVPTEKTALYFFADVEGEFTLQKSEVQEARWVPLSEAESLATWPATKAVCRELQKRVL